MLWISNSDETGNRLAFTVFDALKCWVIADLIWSEHLEEHVQV